MKKKLFLVTLVAGLAARLFAADPTPPAAPAAPAAAPEAAAPAATPPAEAAPTTPVAAPVATPEVAKPAPVASSDKADFVGADTCLSCHEKQGDFKHSIHALGFTKLKNIAADKSCETCHGPGSLHAAAAGDKANSGFASIKMFKDLNAKDANATCMECHQDSARLHWTGGVHEARGLSCVSCHAVHNPLEKKSLLIGKNEAETCYQCHKEIKAQMRRTSHMPVVEGKMGCASCHNPHGSAVAKMVKDDSSRTMCLSCHADKRGPHLWAHPPVSEDCMNCHSPHGSHYDRMLVAKMPFLCQRCHNASRHPPTVYDQTDINNQNNRSLARSCLNCHTNIHGSNHPAGKFYLR